MTLMVATSRMNGALVADDYFVPDADTISLSINYHQFNPQLHIVYLLCLAGF